MLFVTSHTVCVAEAAQGLQPVYFSGARCLRLFQCIPSYKRFSVILFILRSLPKVLVYCIEVSISL
jgi:hypothetical protein